MYICNNTTFKMLSLFCSRIRGLNNEEPTTACCSVFSCPGITSGKDTW